MVVMSLVKHRGSKITTRGVSEGQRWQSRSLPSPGYPSLTRRVVMGSSPLNSRSTSSGASSMT